MKSYAKLLLQDFNIQNVAVAGVICEYPHTAITKVYHDSETQCIVERNMGQFQCSFYDSRKQCLYLCVGSTAPSLDILLLAINLIGCRTLYLVRLVLPQVQSCAPLGQGVHCGPMDRFSFSRVAWDVGRWRFVGMSQGI